MSVEKVETLVIGGGQAGVAMSEHLGKSGLSHLVVERNRIAERWRSERWDSLVANGPAWHDRFPNLTFEGVDPDGFASKQKIVEYFEAYAIKNNSPIRCGVNVEKLTKNTDGSAFAETSSGTIEAKNVIVATGPSRNQLFLPCPPINRNRANSFQCLS